MPTLELFEHLDVDLQEILAGVATLPMERAAALPSAAIGRRSFLKLAGVAGGGLMLAFGLDTRPAFAEGAPSADPSGPLDLNAFVRIAPDNTVTVVSKGPEIGQGIKTTFALIIAEELDADWKTVKVEQALIKPKVYGSQSAGGSTSVPRNWDQLRQAGAAARSMLVAAAAKQWNVPVTECTTSNSVITHTKSGHTLTYGAVTVAACSEPVPDATKVPLKNRADYKLLGKRYTGVDNPKLVTGQPLFGIDVQLPGMLYANYIKCPAVGGKVKTSNLEDVKKMPGVVDVFLLEGTNNPMEVMPGIAVIAKTTWDAFKAKAALKVEWDETTASKDSLTQAAAKAKELGPHLPEPEKNVGDVDAAFASAGKVVEASYDFAMISHQQLEPQNSTAWFHDGVMEMWTPSQRADGGLGMVAKMLKLPEDKITIHQTRAGGGFGRRLMNDYLCEAAAIAVKVNAPVKLQWKREDDFAHDFYRAAGYHFLKGAVDKSGKLSAVQNHVIAFSADGKKATLGAARSDASFPNDIAPSVRYATSLLPMQIPCGWWRAPNDNNQMFVVGSFLHELSVAAGRDHKEFLLEWVNRGASQPKPVAAAEPGTARRPDPSLMFNATRASGVIQMAAEKAGWGKKLPPGHAQGLAFSFAYGGHVAEVVEVSVDAKKRITIHKITAAADIGPIVNMSGAENQVQGGVIDALSTAMGLEINIENGRIQQVNFGDYPILRMRNAPPVDAHFIQSDFRPAGLGESSLPPLAAALGNAIFTATGERVRTMPFKRAGYSLA